MSRDLLAIGNTLASSMAELDISLKELNALRAINDTLLQRCALRLQRKSANITGRVSEVGQEAKNIEGQQDEKKRITGGDREPMVIDAKKYPFLEKMGFLDLLREQQDVKTDAMRLEYLAPIREMAPPPTSNYGGSRINTIRSSPPPVLPLSPTKRMFRKVSMPPQIPFEGASKLVVWGYPYNEHVNAYQEAAYLFHILECASSIPADHFNAYRGTRIIHGNPMLYIHTVGESIALLILRAFQHYKSRFPPSSKPPFWIRREMGYEERIIDKRTQAVVDMGRKMGWDYRKRDNGQIDVYDKGEKVMRLDWDEVERLESVIIQSDEWRAGMKTVDDLRKVVSSAPEAVDETMEELKRMVSNSEAEFKRGLRGSEPSSSPLEILSKQNTGTARPGNSRSGSGSSGRGGISQKDAITITSSPPMPRVPQSSPISVVENHPRPLTERLHNTNNTDVPSPLAAIPEETSSISLGLAGIPQLKLQSSLKLTSVRTPTANNQSKVALAENTPFGRSPGRVPTMGRQTLKKDYTDILSPNGENLIMRDATPLSSL